MKLILENWREYMRDEDVLLESKQNIINLKYPPVLASLFVERFGKNAFIMAKWMKEQSRLPQYIDAETKIRPWWSFALDRSAPGDRSLVDWIELYEALKKGPEEYDSVAKILELGLTYDEIDDRGTHAKAILQQVKDAFFDNTFFRSYTITRDVMEGQLENLHPYKKMDFTEANKKYEEKTIFVDQEPIKKYNNGFRWVDVGYKCNLVGDLMKNCGSAGAMSQDSDRTVLTLFDKGGKPHVVVTYSPNEQRISGDEGQASSKVKDEYHEYVLDLADILDAEFDSTKTKSKLLGIKYRLRGVTDDIERVPSSDPYDEAYFRVAMDGDVYYGTDSMLYPLEAIEAALDTLNGYKEKGEPIAGPLKVKDLDSLEVGDRLASALHYNNARFLKATKMKEKGISTYKIALSKQAAE
jgi:hypothetical protein